MPKTKVQRLKGGTCFMLPSLHQDIVDTVSDDIPQIWFNEQDTLNGSNKKYLTHIMGRFHCYNNSCSAGGWSSKKVAIQIRGYPRSGYNAVVFNQRCRTCKKLGAPNLDKESYIDRVSYRIKKWAGIEMERPFYDSKSGAPHVQALCEGCKRGLCQRGDD